MTKHAPIKAFAINTDAVPNMPTTIILSRIEALGILNRIHFVIVYYKMTI